MEALDSPMFFATGEKLSVLAEPLSCLGTKANLSQNGSSSLAKKKTALCRLFFLVDGGS